MHHRHAAGILKIEQVVAVGHGVERIGNRVVEAQQLARHGAVERIGGSRQRRRSERIRVSRIVCGGQAREVAREHPEVRKHMMAEQHWLGMLQMRVTGHDHAEVSLRLLDQHATKRDIALHQRHEQVFRIQAQIGGHLVVARAARVQASAGRADVGDERRLDRHVNVFVVHVEDERTIVHARLHGREARIDRRGILGGDDALRGEHLGMGARSGDIVRVHILIDLERCAELLGEGVNAPDEPSRPQCH